MRRPALLIACAIVLLGTLPAAAQTYPAKPIRIVVPFVAGGAVDLLARIMGQKLTEALGQPVIVENRPGAGGNAAADLVAKSPPDGYTILQVTNGLAISPALYRKLPFDPVKDLSPVTQLVASQLLLVATPVAAGEDHARADRAREGEARHAQLRHDRRRQSAAPDHGDADARGRRQIPADPLPGRRAAQHRADRGRGASRGRAVRDRQAEHRRRPDARTGDRRRRSVRHRCRTCRPSRKAACRASNRRAGRAGSCRPERRPRSSR